MRPSDVLGISPDADDDTIRRAYRTLARQHHPDKGGDRAKFVELHQAYEAMIRGENWDTAEPFGQSFGQKGTGGSSGSKGSGSPNSSRRSTHYTDDELRDLFRDVEELLSEQFGQLGNRAERSDAMADLVGLGILSFFCSLLCAGSFIMRLQQWTTLLFFQLLIGCLLGLVFVSTLIMLLSGNGADAVRSYRRSLYFFTGLIVITGLLGQG